MSNCLAATSLAQNRSHSDFVRFPDGPTLSAHSNCPESPSSPSWQQHLLSIACSGDAGDSFRTSFRASGATHVSGVDKLVIPLVRGIGQRPKLSNAIFRFANYNPFDPQRYQWPYPVYEDMSAGQPVVYSKIFKDWTVFGYGEVLDVLRSSDVSTAGVVDRLRNISPYTRLSSRSFGNFSKWMLFVDPPDHSRLRGAVSRTFTPKRVAEHEPRVPLSPTSY